MAATKSIQSSPLTKVSFSLGNNTRAESSVSAPTSLFSKPSVFSVKYPSSFSTADPRSSEDMTAALWEQIHLRDSAGFSQAAAEKKIWKGLRSRAKKGMIARGVLGGGSEADGNGGGPLPVEAALGGPTRVGQEDSGGETVKSLSTPQTWTCIEDVYSACLVTIASSTKKKRPRQKTTPAQIPGAVRRVFGREALADEIIKILNVNHDMGFTAARKDYVIIALSGGSGAGKTEMIRYVRLKLDELGRLTEDAKTLLQGRLQTGAHVVYVINFNGAGHKFLVSDAGRYPDVRMGVRLFARLLGVTLADLEQYYKLPKEAERFLTSRNVIALGAQLQREKMGLDEEAVVHTLVCVDELNTGLVTLRGLIKMAPSLWGLELAAGRWEQGVNEVDAAAENVEEVAELVIKGMVESVAEIFTAEGTESESKAGAENVVGNIITAGTGLPMLNLHVSNYVTRELIVTNLGPEYGAEVVKNRVDLNVEGDSYPGKAFRMVAKSKEYRGLLQVYGGIAQSMVWMANEFTSPHDLLFQGELERLVDGGQSVRAVCVMLEVRINKRLKDWGKYPFTDRKGISDLGGIDGILEIVGLSVTGIPVDVAYLVAGRVPLTRTEISGVVFTKPYLSLPVEELQQLQAQPERMAEATSDVATYVSNLPILANPLRHAGTPIDLDLTDSEYLKVLDIPPAVQSLLLAKAGKQKPDEASRLKGIIASIPVVLGAAFKGTGFEDTTLRLIVLRVDLLLRTGHKRVPLGALLRGAIGNEALLATEVILEPLMMATDVQPLLVGEKVKGDVQAARKSPNMIRVNPKAVRWVQGKCMTSITVVEGGQETVREVPFYEGGYAIRADTPAGKCAVFDGRLPLRLKRGDLESNQMLVLSMKNPTGGIGSTAKDVRELCENTSVAFESMAAKAGAGAGFIRVFLSTGTLEHYALAWTMAQDDVIVIAGTGVKQFFPVFEAVPALNDAR